jgi:hypothetical protein
MCLNDRLGRCRVILNLQRRVEKAVVERNIPYQARRMEFSRFSLSHIFSVS